MIHTVGSRQESEQTTRNLKTYPNYIYMGIIHTQLAYMLYFFGGRYKADLFLKLNLYYLPCNNGVLHLSMKLI